MFKKCSGLSFTCSYNERVHFQALKVFYYAILSVWSLIAPVLLYIYYMENSGNGILQKFIFGINLKKESYRGLGKHE